jgi:hypothetical protein
MMSFLMVLFAVLGAIVGLTVGGLVGFTRNKIYENSNILPPALIGLGIGLLIGLAIIPILQLAFILFIVVLIAVGVAILVAIIWFALQTKKFNTTVIGSAEPEPETTPTGLKFNTNNNPTVD